MQVLLFPPTGGIRSSPRPLPLPTTADCSPASPLGSPKPTLLAMHLRTTENLDTWSVASETQVRTLNNKVRS
jgi:hypothetical protein